MSWRLPRWWRTPPRRACELLALSDHDTVDGVDEALAAGALHGVRVVAATEISAVDGPYEDLHVLGYGIDHRSALLARAPAGGAR